MTVTYFHRILPTILQIPHFQIFLFLVPEFPQLFYRIPTIASQNSHHIQKPYGCLQNCCHCYLQLSITVYIIHFCLLNFCYCLQNFHITLYQFHSRCYIFPTTKFSWSFGRYASTVLQNSHHSFQKSHNCSQNYHDCSQNSHNCLQNSNHLYLQILITVYRIPSYLQNSHIYFQNSHLC